MPLEGTQAVWESEVWPSSRAGGVSSGSFRASGVASTATATATWLLFGGLVVLHSEQRPAADLLDLRDSHLHPLRDRIVIFSDALSDSYESLSQNYSQLTNNLENVWKMHCESPQTDYKSLRTDYERVLGELDPKQRSLDNEQARALCHACLDRDLYKLFYFVREKIRGREQRSVESHLQETILDTRYAWNQFKSPFPTVLKIFNLFGIYKDSGSSLVQNINSLIGDELSEDDKIARARGKLLEITIGMKGEFDECLQKLETQRADEILPYSGPPCIK